MQRMCWPELLPASSAGAGLTRQLDVFLHVQLPAGVPLEASTAHFTVIAILTSV